MSVKPADQLSYQQAIHNLKVYEEYRMKKAWGTLLVLIGAIKVVFFTATKLLATNLLNNYISALITYMLNIGVLLYVVYIYVKVKRPKITLNGVKAQYNFKFIVILTFMHLFQLVFSYITSYVFYHLTRSGFDITLLILFAVLLDFSHVGVIITFPISYLIMRNYFSKIRIQEIIITGLVCLAFLPPFTILKYVFGSLNMEILFFLLKDINAIVIIGSYFACGVWMRKNANMALGVE